MLRQTQTITINTKYPHLLSGVYKVVLLVCCCCWKCVVTSQAACGGVVRPDEYKRTPCKQSDGQSEPAWQKFIALTRLHSSERPGFKAIPLRLVRLFGTLKGTHSTLCSSFQCVRGTMVPRPGLVQACSSLLLPAFILLLATVGSAQHVSTGRRLLIRYVSVAVGLCAAAAEGAARACADRCCPHAGHCPLEVAHARTHIRDREYWCCSGHAV